METIEEKLKAAYWDFDARVKGYAPYDVPYGNPEHAFVVSVLAALEDLGDVVQVPRDHQPC